MITILLNDYNRNLPSGRQETQLPHPRKTDLLLLFPISIVVDADLDRPLEKISSSKKSVLNFPTYLSLTSSLSLSRGPPLSYRYSFHVSVHPIDFSSGLCPSPRTGSSTTGAVPRPCSTSSNVSLISCVRNLSLSSTQIGGRDVE